VSARIEQLGLLADRIDNLLGAMQLSMPAQFHLDQLKAALPGLRDQLRLIYIAESGEDPWDILTVQAALAAAVNPIDYTSIPRQVMEALRRHGDPAQRGPTGDFVTAVLENDLHNAVGRADHKSLAALSSIVAWVYNEMPAPAWGSPEKVAAWRAGAPGAAHG
jgi:hypothetical protein